LEVFFSKSTKKLTFGSNFQKSMIRIAGIFISFILLHANAFSQTDTSAYTKFSKNWVWFSDLGFNTGPFSVKFKDENGEKINLKFRNNIRPSLGFGFNYKWLSLRLSFPILGDFKPVSKFGKSNLFNLGFDFAFKKTYFEFSFFNYKGYSILDANRYDTTLTADFPNDILNEVNNVSFSINSWYFHNKQFKMSPLKGKTALYNKEVQTFYLKSTLNVHGVGNTGSIIPEYIQNPSNSKTGATTISAFDFGAIPGYAYVNRKNNWQYSAMIGFGPVIQTKFYIIDGTTRSVLGLAPRYDIRFVAGYNKPRYFIMLQTNFDNKSIRFTDLRYISTFYSIKLVAGIRLNTTRKVINTAP
jgi:hypothetical protein